MSGNFDYPPASPTAEPTANAPSLPPRFLSPESTGLPHIPAHLRHLRELLSSSRGHQRAARASSSAYHPSPMSSSSSTIDPARRRRAIIREIESQVQNRGTAQPSNTSTGAPRTRARLPPDRYLQQQRERRETRNSRALAGLQQAGASLTEASASLNNLFDEPRRLMSPDIIAQEYSGEAEVNRRRRFKRRKLEAESQDDPCQGFSYGHYGQVVPGPLTMEIASCDGGHLPGNSSKDEYWAENILRNDKSVYCTKGNSCNLVLKHQGATAFCLKKLVIKAPQMGFTAPIQEGMVFVSMRADDLISRTAEYRIQYNPLPSQSSPSSNTTLDRPDGPDVSRLISSSMNPQSGGPESGRRNRYGANVPSWWPHRLHAPEQALFDLPRVEIEAHPGVDATEPCEYPLINLDFSTENVVPAPTPPPLFSPFVVTQECSDDSADEEEESSPATMADLSRRGFISSAYSDNEDDDDDGGMNPRRNDSMRMRPPGSHFRRRPSRRRMPSRIEPTNPLAGDEVKEENDGEGHDIMVPHARFFIEREKSMVSIKFDPPVSGRYILLKLWSPADNENIDIQCIQAHGFAGPRFFPAIQMR
ncbi:MAG: hypothetical protein M1827_000601 [Pycnora praestabilis]|nr:MAG: hypothetical protein M1827_000601 [Pycnora praestabilis]